MECVAGKPFGGLEYPRVRIALVVLALIWVVLPAYGQESPSRVASRNLNEFDLASYCYGAAYLGSSTDNDQAASNQTEMPTGRFGYVNPPAASSFGVPEFIYITSRYYVRVGPYGDPGDCELKRYLYRVTNEGLFVREEINAKQFSTTEQDLRDRRRSAAKQSSGRGAGEAQAGPEDSVGNCLFPIRWVRFGNQTYALFSIAAPVVGIVDYVIPHYERSMNGSPSNCSAWGERHVTNSSIVSGDISILSAGDHRLFVEMSHYQRGFMFDPAAEFQCVSGHDVLARDILLTKEFFDREVRPGLQEILAKSVQSERSKRAGANTTGELAIVSFSDSVFLNHEFAAFVSGVAAERGCK